MRLSPRIVAAAVALSAAPVVSFAGVTPTTVDLELSLLVDVSGSISAGEFALQRTGYSNAFRTPGIKSQITSTSSGRLGRIAVNVIYWSSADEQAVAVDWTLLDSAAACDAFADAIDATSRTSSGQTSIQGVLDFARPLFLSNNFDGFRKVIDISSDGSNNDLDPGRTLPVARAETLGVVDAINALVIGDNTLLTYYNNNVVGGTNFFALQAENFDAFGNAIFRKLTFEIPAPGSLAVIGLGGLAALRRRR
jgi:uncharacterized protein (TIGR03382 family)